MPLAGSGGPGTSKVARLRPARDREAQSRLAWALGRRGRDSVSVRRAEVLNKEWAGLFLVIGVSWLDTDDDKLNFCSNLWKACGFKMTPTKDSHSHELWE
ncbi:hypothetical protein THAOC_21460 [Thalassiosira oceanica]|uniref:Uncharacterized protein n=1 Tax=Thalassiosira oceanica TaxID=159749 RepID=K0SBV0_THAOC|nr:hypothetical protein THAOC_21460 [Thalassiosira oceanica]|eukprot:EJK58416.1 hypothetical protein THAOC_21460 [Thalassiosira oceanica]